jgi:SulP family sulfate permease
MNDTAAKLFPPFAWWHRVTGAALRADALAGFTNTAIVLPQSVAFATIAGLPPQYGLYTAMVTAVVAALFGSSMVMISGPTTAISAVLFATLADHAEPGSVRYVELTLLITMMIGLFQLVAGLARLGGLIAFVSHSVMTAFAAAAAVLIAVSQLAGILGVSVEGGGTVVERVARIMEAANETNLLALAISLSALTLAVLFQRFAPRLPGLFIALVAAVAIGWIFDAGARGVAMVGALPTAFPSFDPPLFSATDVSELAPGAAAIALIALLEAITIGRAFAVRRRERFDANQEMVGQGLSNLVGGLFQSYAGSGSFTRSGVNAAAGAVTPLSAVFSSVFLAIILAFVAPLVAHIPTPAMAGLILYVAWRLIDLQEIRRVLSTSRSESVILLLTFGAGLLIELDFAIYVGVIASFAVFIYQTAYPSLRISAPTTVDRSGRRKFRNAELHRLLECPEILNMRLDGPLYFGSVEHVEREFRRIERERPNQKHIVFYLKGVGKLDMAAADLLIHEIRNVRARGGTFRIVALFPPLLANLRRYNVIDELGEANLHISKGEAIEAAIGDINYAVCAGCSLRVWLECAWLPGGPRQGELVGAMAAECQDVSPVEAARRLTRERGRWPELIARASRGVNTG